MQRAQDEAGSQGAFPYAIGGPLAYGGRAILYPGIRNAAARAQIHGDDIIHEDVKPENILIRPSTIEVKIGNLGMASRLPREHAAPQSSNRVESAPLVRAP